MPELKLSFHSTFALKKQDVLKILQAADTTAGLSDTMQSLIERTGLGNKKISPIKSWAVRSGLVSHNALTPEGQLTRQYDPYLESPLTEWLMHFYLSFGDAKQFPPGGNCGLQPPPEDPAEWGGWSYLVFRFLPEHSAFTLDDLVQASAPVFPAATPANLRDNFRIVLRAYTERHALWACHFLQRNGDNRFERGHTQLPNLELVSYFLAKLWERDFANHKTVTVGQLLEQPMGLAPILGIDSAQFLEILTQLSSLGWVQQTGVEWDIHIHRCWQNPISLLEKAYQGG